MKRKVYRLYERLNNESELFKDFKRWYFVGTYKTKKSAMDAIEKNRKRNDGYDLRHMICEGSLQDLRASAEKVVYEEV